MSFPTLDDVRNGAPVAVLQQAAELGHPQAQVGMGILYRNGECGLAMDHEAACRWFQLAADQNDPDACYYLSLHLVVGRGVERDLRKGFDLCRETAEAGHAASQFAFGKMIESGNEDPQEGMRWYRMAADQGYADAQFELGKHYLEGEGVIGNPVEARKWFQLAADQGHTEAAELLATLEPAATSADAIAEYQQQALANDGVAQLKLGIAYHLGEGAPKSPELAYFWIMRAMLAGSYDAAQYIQPIVTQVPMEKMGALQTATYAWTPGMPVPEL